MQENIQEIHMQEMSPIGDKVILEPIIAGETTKGGLRVPDSARKKMRIAKVLAVGKGVATENGFIPTTVKQGDSVLFDWNKVQELIIQEKKYLVGRECDLLGTVEE